MPYRQWTNRCACEAYLRTAEPTCPTCGQARDYAGWAFSMHESMARYQSLYRLKPVGPHRKMADEALRNLTASCEACEGVGLLDAPPGFRVCESCRGLGRVFTMPVDVVDGIRNNVLEHYPEAAAAPVTGFPGGPVIQDMSSGAMLGAEARPHEEES